MAIVDNNNNNNMPKKEGGMVCLFLLSFCWWVQTMTWNFSLHNTSKHFKSQSTITVHHDDGSQQWPPMWHCWHQHYLAGMSHNYHKGPTTNWWLTTALSIDVDGCHYHPQSAASQVSTHHADNITDTHLKPCWCSQCFSEMTTFRW